MGVWTVQSPPGVVFGDNLVTLKPGSDQTLDTSALGCLARIAPPSEVEKRGKWCCTPLLCADCDDHARPDGISHHDLDIKSVAGVHDRSQWTEMVAPAAPCQYVPAAPTQSPKSAKHAAERLA